MKTARVFILYVYQNDASNLLTKEAPLGASLLFFIALIHHHKVLYAKFSNTNCGDLINNRINA